MPSAVCGHEIPLGDLWASPEWATTACHEYHLSNAYSSQEFVMIDGTIVKLGTGGGGNGGAADPFRVTVPSVDVDWVGFADWNHEAGEETRFVIVPLNTNRVDDIRTLKLNDPFDDDQRNGRRPFPYGGPVHPDITLHWEAGDVLSLFKGNVANFVSGTTINGAATTWPLNFTVNPLQPALTFKIYAKGQVDDFGAKAVDTIRGRVVNVDLDVDANYDGVITDADEPLEEKQGGLVCVCTNKLTPITLKLEPANLPGKLTLSATGGRIRVWREAARATPVPLPATWPAGAYPPILYVEGTNNSATARDVELRLEYNDKPAENNALFKCADIVRLTVIKVESIDIVSGATAISDGTATPADTDVCAAIKNTGDILLQANLDSDIPEADLPSGFITWTGGSPVTGHPLQRKVSKSTWSKTEVKVLCGGTPSYTMITYVIGAEPTGTKRDGTPFADNSQAVSTGMHGPTGVDGDYQSNIEIEFSIRPSDLFTDGIGNLFDKTDIQWDVSRDKKVRYWKRVSGTWSFFDDRSSSWSSDDSHDTEEDNDPWDGNGHIYGNDTPGWVGQGDWLVSKLNMREWVRVGLGGMSGRNGTICSDYQYWRAFRSISQSLPVWVDDNTYDNELEDSTAFWGSVPPVP